MCLNSDHTHQPSRRRNPHVRPSVTPPIAFILLILLVIFSIPAGAATFTVTNLNDKECQGALAKLGRCSISCCGNLS
ncbi:exported hypothetical protein [Candidatus Contendobacter odensis Run_B_J11]|uniref:Uncharacterized protein n=1 Tax=Candidatus Contendobacter odensis Run_B_J11 TaxID=1400861 RepID=A0A7U7GAW5_9GAMM|nr:exported hypothetical protein [Candidatus Contendobacter odensis Run_B_J11]